jgi:hypothetical protein
MCADYCPVPDIEGVCKHEDREEEVYVLTPKGCLEAALITSDVVLNHDTLDSVWKNFVDLMGKFGYRSGM